MKLCTVLLGAAIMVCFLHAQSSGEKKFNIYGFADARLSKIFFKEHSPGGLELDSRWTFTLDHVNLYQDFRPNDHVRMLTELSFQENPVTQSSAQTGLRLRIDMPDVMGMGGESIDSVLLESKPAPGHSTLKDYLYFEWGSVSVQRAMFSVLFNRYINVSAGKFITPAGIWNVDHGSPAIMTVMQPTQYSTIAIFPQAQLGLMEEGRIFIGDADLSYCLYLSSGRQALSFENPRDMGGGGQAVLYLPALDECRIGISGYTGTVREQTTTGVIHFTAADIAALGQQAAAAVMAENPGAMADMQVFYGLVAEKLYEMMPNEMMGHLSYEYENAYKYRENVFGIDTRLKKWIFGLQGEFNYLLADNYLVDDAQSGILAYYVLGSVDLFKREEFTLTPYAMWEQLKFFDQNNNPMIDNSLDSKGGVQSLASGASNSTYGIYQYRTFKAGVNMRLFSNFGVKLEYYYITANVIKSGVMASMNDDDMSFNWFNTQFYVAF